MGRAQARTGTLEEGQVRAMFDRIAGFYDVMNSVMTAGLHHGWRRRAVDLARVGPGDRVLDVATGTGDLALELAGRVAPGGEVIASDFSEEMLARARTKGADAPVLWGRPPPPPPPRGRRGPPRAGRPGGGGAGRETPPPPPPPLSTFYRLW